MRVMLLICEIIIICMIFFLRIVRLNHVKLMLFVNVHANYCQYCIIIFVNVVIMLVSFVNAYVNIHIFLFNVMLLFLVVIIMLCIFF